VGGVLRWLSVGLVRWVKSLKNFFEAFERKGRKEISAKFAKKHEDFETGTYQEILRRSAGMIKRSWLGSVEGRSTLAYWRVNASFRCNYRG
jgi:hypothetical protein